MIFLTIKWFVCIAILVLVLAYESNINGSVWRSRLSGIGIAFQPNNTRITFGNSGTTTSYEDFSISDFTSLQAIFDDVKFAKITVEAWVNAQPSDTSTSLSNAPEIWACNDTNDCYPSTSSIQRIC